MSETNTTHGAASAASYQTRVDAWLIACFGETIARDKQERNHRFLEEALELVQACECTAGEAHQLVDYVFGRAIGDPYQESGGVSNTHAALCLSRGIDMEAAAETELARVWTKVEKIRAKQAAKPKHSPLPEALATPSAAPAVSGRVLKFAGQLVDEIDGLISESDGVAGLHQNGDLAPWDELEPGGRYERLTSLDELRGAVAAARSDEAFASVPTLQAENAGLREAFENAVTFLESDAEWDAPGTDLYTWRKAIAEPMMAALSGPQDQPAADPVGENEAFQRWVGVVEASAATRRAFKAGWNAALATRPAQAPSSASAGQEGADTAAWAKGFITKPKEEGAWDGHVIDGAMDLAQERAALAPAAQRDRASREEIARIIKGCVGLVLHPETINEVADAILAARLGAEPVAEDRSSASVPSALHAYEPHENYPHCAVCGYARSERLMHSDSCPTTPESGAESGRTGS